MFARSSSVCISLNLFLILGRVMYGTPSLTKLLISQDDLKESFSSLLESSYLRFLQPTGDFPTPLEKFLLPTREISPAYQRNFSSLLEKFLQPTQDRRNFSSPLIILLTLKFSQIQSQSTYFLKFS